MSAISSPRKVETGHDVLQALVVEALAFTERRRALPPLGRPGLGFEVERHQVSGRTTRTGTSE